MYLDDRNIYQIARKTAGYTQEYAAEMLGVSVESIRAYESGTRRPPNQTVSDMCIAYNSPLLGHQHLRATADGLGAALPEVREVTMPEAVVAILDSVYDFVDKHRDRDLIRIARDGVIDGAERQEYDAIMRELQAIVQAAVQLNFAKDRRN